MAQEQVTPTPPVQQATTTPQAPVGQTQAPVGQEQPPAEKKSKWWLWAIIALVVIGAGVGAYFLFFAA